MTPHDHSGPTCATCAEVRTARALEAVFEILDMKRAPTAGETVEAQMQQPTPQVPRP